MNRHLLEKKHANSYAFIRKMPVSSKTNQTLQTAYKGKLHIQP